MITIKGIKYSLSDPYVIHYLNELRSNCLHKDIVTDSLGTDKCNKCRKEW
jgi:hypothetical protein